jgi:hypothetical protein
MTHLETHWKEGMSWANYGGRSGWGIDHIRPDCEFQYTSTNDSGFQASWALNNLQPLWLWENIQKHTRKPKRKPIQLHEPH